MASTPERRHSVERHSCLLLGQVPVSDTLDLVPLPAPTTDGSKTCQHQLWEDTKHAGSSTVTGQSPSSLPSPPSADPLCLHCFFHSLIPGLALEKVILRCNPQEPGLIRVGS